MGGWVGGGLVGVLVSTGTERTIFFITMLQKSNASSSNGSYEC